MEAYLKYIDGEEMYIRELHVIHKGEESEPNLAKREKISSSAIENVLNTNIIKEIAVTDNNIIFSSAEIYNNKNHEFWGRYYSMNGKPQIVAIKDSGELEPDGEGWSFIVGKSDRRYYTKKIKGKFYYFVVK